MASRVASVRFVRVTSTAGLGRVSVASRSRAVARAGVSARGARLAAFDAVVASTAARGRGRARRDASTRAAATEDDADAAAEEPFAWYKDPARLAIAGAWVSLGSFATFGAPAGTSAFAADTPIHAVVLKCFLIRFGLRILQSVKCVFRYAFFHYENVGVLLLPSIPPPAPSPQPSGKVGPATSRSAVE